MASSPKMPIWWIVVLTAAAVLPRLPVVPAAFDVEDQFLLQQVSGPAGLLAGVLGPVHPGFYRPLTVLHFEICQAAFGEWAPGFHMASIAIHGLVVWLVYLLCTRVGGSGRHAMVAALAFALLPSHNEAIAWAASAGDLWATVFTIAAALLALAAVKSKPAAEPWLWVVSLATMVVGFAAKETAIVAALLAPSAAWLFGRRRPAWGWMAAYPAVAAAYLSWYATRVGGAVEGVLVPGSPWRCLVRTVQTLVMALVPVGRNPVGDWLWSGQAMTRLLTIGGMSVLGVSLVLALRKGDRTTVFGWLWAVAACVPVCRLPWAERYAYLPAVGLALVGGAALNRVLGRRTSAVSALAAAILIVFAVGSILSANHWTRRVGRYPRAQNRSSAAAQWKPAPKAVKSTRSPGLTRPC